MRLYADDEAKRRLAAAVTAAADTMGTTGDGAEGAFTAASLGLDGGGGGAY